MSTIVSLLILLPIISADHHISAEIPHSIVARTCSYDRVSQLVDGMQLFAKHPQLCIAMVTSKSIANLEHDLQRSTQLTARVTITWSAVDDDDTRCRMQFKGYQHIYRLSPDFGHYPSCQRDIARHVHALSQNNNNSMVNSDTCPYVQFPTTIDEYHRCGRGLVHVDRWYRIQFMSTIRYETYRRELLGYRQSWSNYSCVLLVKPQLNTWIEGTVGDWLQPLIDVRLRKSRTELCAIHYLLILDRQWTGVESIMVVGVVHYSMHSVIVFERSLSVTDSWLDGEIEIASDSARLCIKTTLISIDDNSRQHRIDSEQCRPVVGDKSCMPMQQSSGERLTVFLPALGAVLLWCLFNYEPIGCCLEGRR